MLNCVVEPYMCEPLAKQLHSASECNEEQHDDADDEQHCDAEEDVQQQPVILLYDAVSSHW